MSQVRFENYLKYEKQYSAHTLKAYSRDLAQFYDFVQVEFDLEGLKAKHYHIRAWIVSMMQQEVTSRTINRKISVLRSYFRFLQKTQERSDNPTDKIISPKIGKTLPTVLHTYQLDMLFSEVAFPEGFQGVRDRLLLKLLYATGMRNAELVNLQVRNIDFSAKSLKVKGKGSKERLVPLIPELLRDIKEYLLLRADVFEEMDEEYLVLKDDGQKVYPKFVYNLVRKYLAQVTSLQKKGPHTLRHSFATHLCDEGADLSAIKNLMGHASLASTEVYLHNSIAKLKEVYKKAHPRAKKD